MIGSSIDTRNGFSDYAIARGTIDIERSPLDISGARERMRLAHGRSRDADVAYDAGIIAGGEYQEFVDNCPGTVRDAKHITVPRSALPQIDVLELLDELEAGLRGVLDESIVPTS